MTRAIGSLTTPLWGLTLAVLTLATPARDAFAGASADPSATPPDAPVVTEGVINAPRSEVWRAFTTADGFKRWGVAHCDVDLRVGGLIRTHYKPDGVLGDEGTIQNRILAFEPERMIAFCIDKPPKGFPFQEAWRSTWSVATLTDLGDGRTHLRLAGMGYQDNEESRKMRTFFENGNRWSFDKLRSTFDASIKVKPMASAHDDPSPENPVDAAPTAALVFEHSIASPRADVWRLLATPGGWRDFFGVTSRIEAYPGGAWEIEFDDDAPAGSRGSEGCKVLSLIPERMLSFSWNAPPKFPFARGKHTWVVIELERPEPDRTLVRLTHLGFAERAREHPAHAPEFVGSRAYFEKAWPKVLEALASESERDLSRGSAGGSSGGSTPR